MAEVATGVLHNVGNVLNSANVSVSLLREAVRNSELPQLARTVGLLETRRDTLAEFLRDDARGRLVLPFLGQLSTQLDAEHRRLAEEIGTLQRSIEHIKEIVAMQQTFARTAAVIEEVSAAELLRHCLEIHQGSLDRHQVRFELEIAPDVPALTTDRHNVLQILNNFVSNAIHATKAKLPGQRLIVVRAERLDADRVALSVRDNGAGIPPENLPRIFRLGFTTRKDGHGFGLHSGVLAARSLGGALDVFSAGAGQGATFTLTLPIRLAEPAFKTT
jgi:signal transduction histidine kinase